MLPTARATRSASTSWPASAAAQKVNLDAAASADYEQMVQEGCTVLYVGTATFKGDDACNVDHADWPKTVHFRLCFKSPTSYVNCQNPDNDPAMAFDGEEHQRGIAFPSNSGVVAQVTIHTDHPFWDSVVHDSPAHFDQFAARVVGQDAGEPTVTLEDTMGVDYTAYTDALGRPLQWRYCIDPPTDAHPKVTGAMAFASGERSARQRKQRGDRPSRLLRLRDVQPEHAGPPQLGRPLLREAQLPVAALRSILGSGVLRTSTPSQSRARQSSLRLADGLALRRRRELHLRPPEGRGARDAAERWCSSRWRAGRSWSSSTERRFK